MKKIFTIVFTLVALVSYADNIKVSGYLLNSNEKTTIEIYKDGKLIEVREPLFYFYKLKLDVGYYTILFKSGNHEKLMFISIETKKNIQIDVDYNKKSYVSIALKGNKLTYIKLPPEENFEK